MANNQNQGSSVSMLALAAGCAWAAWAVPNDAAQWVFGATGLLAGIAGSSRLRMEMDRNRKRREAEKPSGVHGTAAFMTGDGAARAGLNDPAGLFLGALGGRMLFHSGKAHLLTVAPARSGKGIAAVIPNLLHYQGSVFVTDPKGELAAVTAQHRARTFGQKVRVLNPWGLYGLPQDRFNPLGYLIALYADAAQRRGLSDEVGALALQLIPEPEDARNRFFREGSRKLLRAFLLHFASRERPQSCTLPELWRTLQNAARMEAMLVDMAGSDALGGVVADLADDIARTIEKNPESFQSFVEGATQAVSIFDPSGWLADSVAASDFSFEEMKANRVTVYVVIPSERIATHGAWLGLLTRQAIAAVARQPGNTPVLFMLDEFANMGKLAGLSESLTLLPGLGVRVWMIVQALDQLRAVYGREAANTILSQAEVQQFFAVQDLGLAKMLSEALGQRTVKTTSINLGRKENDDPGESRGEAGRPLMSPDEIRQMADQLLLIQSHPPIRAQRVPFWNVAPWQHWAAANPVEGAYPRPAPSYRLSYKEKPDA
ncbi:Type IV secretory system conjugative DNA transfer family protein [Hyphomicrobiales bacterium]|nr:Type IV secretory system conjugative DNA transfer family protein [Hyphomicrobiales bacterium]CAH1698730.1 Type IV secretory system conjugative DNA transfer family protein [Hyphomicrobiales bacterium]CAI0342378.1 type IV secretion system protein VirD4 [Hyphomicrobiales bacterium]